MNPDIPEDDLRERDLDVVWLRDLHHDAVHLGHGAGEARGGRRVGDAERAVGAHAVGDSVHLLYDLVLTLACINDDVRTVLLRERETFVARVDANDV